MFKLSRSAATAGFYLALLSASACGIEEKTKDDAADEAADAGVAQSSNNPETSENTQGQAGNSDGSTQQNGTSSEASNIPSIPGLLKWVDARGELVGYSFSASIPPAIADEQGFLWNISLAYESIGAINRIYSVGYYDNPDCVGHPYFNRDDFLPYISYFYNIHNVFSESSHINFGGMAMYLGIQNDTQLSTHILDKAYYRDGDTCTLAKENLPNQIYSKDIELFQPAPPFKFPIHPEPIAP